MISNFDSFEDSQDSSHSNKGFGFESGANAEGENIDSLKFLETLDNFDNEIDSIFSWIFPQYVNCKSIKKSIKKSIPKKFKYQN